MKFKHPGFFVYFLLTTPLALAGIALVCSAVLSLAWQYKSKPKADIQSLMLQQIQQSSELTTTKFVIEVIVPVTQDRTIAGVKVAESKLLYVAHGEVEAGFDLSQAQVSDNIITLPAPKIIGQKIDVNKSYVYSVSNGALNLGPNTSQFQSIAEKQALTKMVESACKSGILNNAKERGIVVIKELVNVATINVQESKKCETES